MSFTDKARNKVQKTVGKIKEKGGDATDNRDLQAEGQADQIKADTKQAGEKLKNTGEDIKDAFKK